MGHKIENMVQIEEVFDEPEPQPEPKSAAPKPCKDNIVGQAQRGGVKINSEKGAELDKAAKEEAWHWKEIDLTQTIRDRLKDLFKRHQVAKTSNAGQEVEVEVFKAEHWGEAMATQRKGKGKVICNFRVDVKWRGKLMLGGNVVGSCQGTIRFPEVNSEKQPREWEMLALWDGEERSAMRMLNPCGSLEETPLRELEPVEQSIKEVMLKTTPQKVLESVQQLMLELHEKANAPVTFDVVEPELEPQPEQNSNVPSHIQ